MGVANALLPRSDLPERHDTWELQPGGQSLYVEVRRGAPVLNAERSAIRVIVSEFDVEDEIERFGIGPAALTRFPAIVSLDRE